MNKTTAILASVLAVLLVVGAFIGGYFSGKGRRPQPSVVVQTDTIVFRDTVTKILPEYITKEVIRRELVEVRDTVTVNDTTYVALPVERREYRDSDYVAVVTGIRPALESISVYPKTKVVTTTITVTEEPKKKHWHFGLQGGAGVVYDAVHNKVGAGPYIGGGISYTW